MSGWEEKIMGKRGKKGLILEIKEGGSNDPGNCDPTKWAVAFTWIINQVFVAIPCDS